MTVLAALLALAAKQHQATHVHQAVEVGVSEPNAARQLRGYGFEQLHERVWSAPGSEDTPLRRMSAALLAAGPRAAITAESGLWLHGILDTPPDEPRVVVPMGRYVPRELEGVRVIASRTYDPKRRTTRQRLSVAFGERCIVDGCLAPHPTVDEVRDWMLTGLQRKALDKARIEAELHDCKGVPGAAIHQRAYLDATSVGADSPFTRRVRDRLVRDGVTPDDFPATVPTGDRTLKPDLTFLKNYGKKAGIECDGLAFHSEQRDVAIDGRKDRAYKDADWFVPRIGWWEFTNGWPSFLADLRRHLES